VLVAASLTNAGAVGVTVTDNGVGIAASDIDRVFEPFFTRRSKGTGLGLTVSREIVHLHQGRIAITSNPCVETKVTIILPLGKAHYDKKETVDY